MRTASTRVAAVVVWLSFALPNTFALPLNKPPVAYTGRTWQMKDGLPEPTVQAFAQTADRYLWIGTTGGLLRFDGMRFVLYDRENTPAFAENNIFCLTVSRDNSLWIGTEGGGLIRYRNGSFRAFSSKDGLTNDFVRVVFQSRSGDIWIGTDNGLFRLAGEQIERVDNTGNVPLLAVHAITEDSRAGLWVGGSKLLRLQANEAVEFHLSGEASQNRVKSIAETLDGTIWVGAVSGLHRMIPSATGIIFQRIKEISGTVRFLHETSEGTFWIGTIGHGIYKYRDHQFSRLTAPDTLPSNSALNLFEDVEKNVWIGTQAGMLRLSKTPVRIVGLPDAADSDAETIYQDRDGDLWVAAANLFRFHEGTVTRYRFPGITGVRIRNVFRDNDGALWVGTEGNGAFRQRGANLFHYTTRQGLVNNFVRVFLQATDGSMWIATDEGVSRWQTQGFTNFRMRDGLCYFSTRALFQDRLGDIWVGTDRGVSRLHEGRFEKDAVTEALKNEKIWAILGDPDGGLWFGTRTGGLYRWRSGKLTHYTVKQGLASNSIYEMIEDRKDNFWISGPNGISVINRRELDAIADDPSLPLALTLYGISDGLETTQMYGAEKPGGVLTSQGEIWFASNRGPVRVSLDPVTPSSPAPVVIDQVVADGLELPSLRKITLGPDNAKVEMHYSVVMLQSQERIRFRYMLEGFDKNWTDASSRRAAYYTNLPPGGYRFRVAAFEMNSPTEISESAVEIIQKPHLYRTPWFLGCCLLLLAAAVWASHQFRLRQLHTRFQAVLDERSRLAREMHDTLIQGSAGVSALLEAHLSLDSSEKHAKEELLKCAREQIRSTMNEAREAVWNLRHGGSATTIGPLLGKMTKQVSHEFGVPIDYQLSGKAFDLDQPTAHEVLMVVREALHNAVWHGQPTRVGVNVCFERNKLNVQVKDDGRGFDPELASSLPDGHYGLIGMRERVQRIGGKFILNTRSGAGTELTLQVPRNAFVHGERPEA